MSEFCDIDNEVTAPEEKDFDIRFVKCREPILIRDESKTEEENQVG